MVYTFHMKITSSATFPEELERLSLLCAFWVELLKLCDTLGIYFES